MKLRFENALQSPLGDFLNNRGSNAVNAFNGGGSTREACKAIFAAAGFRPALLADAHRMNYHNFIVALYAYELRFTGREKQPSVYGNEFVNQIGDVASYFKADRYVDATDIACIGINSMRHDGVFSYVDCFMTMWPDLINKAQVGEYAAYSALHTQLSDTHILKMFKESNHGEFLNSFVNKLHEYAVREDNVKRLMINMRGRNEWVDACLNVTAQVEKFKNGGK